MWRPRRAPSHPVHLRTQPNALHAGAALAVSHQCTPYATDAPTNIQHLPPSYFLPYTPRTLTTSTTPLNNNSGSNSPDNRTVALGHTIRTLQERMPTLLQSPLPTEILSPSISLHLFPSTHPHLPAVRGRVAYIAALWTAPVAWGRLPGGKNTTLEVVSERMLPDEKLRIRWRTNSGADEFAGVFVFGFDERGRVEKHVIENSEEDDGERLAGVITVTEWLIRKAKGGGEKAGGGLAWQFQRVRKEG